MLTTKEILQELDNKNLNTGSCVDINDYIRQQLEHEIRNPEKIFNKLHTSTKEKYSEFKIKITEVTNEFASHGYYEEKGKYAFVYKYEIEELKIESKSIGSRGNDITSLQSFKSLLNDELEYIDIRVIPTGTISIGVRVAKEDGNVCSDNINISIINMLIRFAPNTSPLVKDFEFEVEEPKKIPSYWFANRDF